MKGYNQLYNLIKTQLFFIRRGKDILYKCNWSETYIVEVKELKIYINEYIKRGYKRDITKYQEFLTKEIEYIKNNYSKWKIDEIIKENVLMRLLNE